MGTTACEQVANVYEVGLVSATSVNCICCYPAAWSTNKTHFSFLMPQLVFWVISSSGICYLSLIVLAFLYDVLWLPL